MDKDLEQLKKQWSSNKKEITTTSEAIEQQLQKLKAKKKSSAKFHYGNIVVLAATVVMLVLFFYFLAPVQHVLSRVGVGLMIGGLILRIIIEFVSVAKVKKINMADLAVQNLEQTRAFYNFRRVIHKPITIAIFAAYSIGFFMLMPEFSNYFEAWQLIVMNVSYIAIASVLIWIIRKDVKKELKNLSEIIAVKQELTKAE
ncbi:hypothetical protein [Aquimarina brevivitae]|uniref:Uncharacterized protein n=1 Tax=Aquimarina brevivitae TaxID=323412 RepID=A0A4Q7P0J9_9FLAO|nr:hypothetical protein [Aquimarina brevivitae]RZS93184.1 hypothetical protein EV197_1754 [Aquimarina brevivitae]